MRQCRTQVLAKPALRVRLSAGSSPRNRQRGVSTWHDSGNSYPQGVIPAALLPFNEDMSIDGASFATHLSDLAAVSGVTAITINSHSTEVSSCDFDEQRHVLDLALDAVGGRMPIVNGVYADGSLEAAKLARMAHDAGASCLLVFPPNVYRGGQRPEMAIEHFRRIADASDLPLILFQYATSAGGQCYPLKTIIAIADAVPTLMAIKDGCASPELHERARARAAIAAAAAECALDAQFMALQLAALRLQRAAIGQRKRDCGSACAALRGGAQPGSGRGPENSTTASTRLPKSSTPRPASTCITA